MPAWLIKEDFTTIFRCYKRGVRVQCHMQSQGLRSVVTKRYNHKSNCGNIPSDKENILNRDFEVTTINQK